MPLAKRKAGTKQDDPVRINLSLKARERDRYIAAAAKAPGRPSLASFVRMALDEKIKRDGLA